MFQHARRPSPWLTFVLRVAGLSVCLLVLQQCNRPPGTTGPTGPSTPPNNQPPTVPPPSSTIPVTPQIFVGAGDIASCTSRDTAEATAKLLDTIGGTVYTLGDNAYPNGSTENFRDCYEPTWGRHKDRTRPAPGNHDYMTPGGGPYFRYFGANAGPAGLGYYSYDLGAWHILSLNSNEASGAQESWLRADLAASTAKCTLAYWHHPLFTSGQNGDNGHMRPIYRLLYDAGAEVVLAGHDHSYERFAPQDADGRPDSARGIRQFVVGTGGVPFYPFPQARPNSERKITGPGNHGVLKFVLQADSYQWEFITVGQGVADSGSGICH